MTSSWDEGCVCLRGGIAGVRAGLGRSGFQGLGLWHLGFRVAFGAKDAARAKNSRPVLRLGSGVFEFD